MITFAQLEKRIVKLAAEVESLHGEITSIEELEAPLEAIHQLAADARAIEVKMTALKERFEVRRTKIEEAESTLESALYDVEQLATELEGFEDTDPPG